MGVRQNFTLGGFTYFMGLALGCRALMGLSGNISGNMAKSSAELERGQEYSELKIRKNT